MAQLATQILINHGHVETEDQIPPSLPLQKGGITPSLAKRGKGRFSEAYVFIIMRSLVSGSRFGGILLEE